MTLASVKECLGIPVASTKEDARLNKAITRANAEVLRHLCLEQWGPKQYTVSVVLDCRDLRLESVCIGPQPVMSVDELKCLGAVQETATYRHNGQWIELCKGLFPCGCTSDGEPTVEATITAGFDQTKPAIKLMYDMVCGGATDYAIAIYQGGPSSGFKTEKDGRFSRTRFSPSELVGLNASVAWPMSLSTALAEFWRPETGACLVATP